MVLAPWSLSAALTLALGGLCGCATYQFGTASLYQPNIRTIHVPMVRNDTFRHEIGGQLTEALIRSIELRTPYKVVADPNADSTLTCRVSNQAKRVVAENAFDEPRVLNSTVSVELTWTDRRGNLLLTNRFVPAGELAFYFIQGANFVPEGGQSMGTAHHQAVEQLAEQIVSQMESRW
ncbi:MAG: LptE family protein [Pirellulaceae bacterium]|nr:LptE family protein [Pirellulaceae bacterium]